MGLEVTVDPDLCIGSGDCVRLVPQAFVIDESLGVSVALPGATDLDRELVLLAATGCPTQAIRVMADGAVVHESNGGQAQPGMRL